MRGYFLESARLGFRVWTEQDFPLAQGLWGDPKVTALTGGPLGESQLRQRLALEIANYRRYGIQYWPIFLKDCGEHVGCCGLRPYATHLGVFEFGLHLRRAFWAQGLGREAAQAVVGHAFGIRPSRGCMPAIIPRIARRGASSRVSAFATCATSIIRPRG